MRLPHTIADPVGLAALAVASLLAVPVFAGERAYPVDCLPDRLTHWDAALPEPELRFGASFLPGVVLSPPGDSLPYQGAFTVASLGFGGSATVEFEDIVIEDRPGPDFIVFENAFFRLPLPMSAADDFFVFVEPAFVEVSRDGESWARFPHDAAALAQVADQQSDGTVDRGLYLQLEGLAGLTPTFSGNWTRANEPGLFDPAGVGGVSGAGGDAFDLATVGLTDARFVRIVDAATGVGFAGNGEGFDLDTVVVLHGRPLAATALDTDGDRLSDLAETTFYGSDPSEADSDGDGVDDGREVAGCRDPVSAADVARFHGRPRLWLLDAACTEIRWSYVGAGASYEVIRGSLDGLGWNGSLIDLGATVCLGSSTGLRWSCDPAAPLPTETFFYLVTVDGGNAGHGAGLAERSGAIGCP